jgi:hypothetical protein
MARNKRDNVPEKPPTNQVQAGGRIRGTHKPANKGGRPSVLTDDVRTVLLAAIAKGLSFDRAAHLAGINERTFCHWRRIGKADTEAGNESAYSALCHDIKRSRSAFVAEALERISNAGRAQWQANAWILERLFPDEFASDRRELRQAIKQLAELELKLAELQAKK